MIQLEISAIPNQTISARLDDAFYIITLKTAAGIVSADINRDGVDIVQGQRVSAGSAIIPYEYLANGNFVIITENEEYASYEKFGASQFLLYLTLDEVLALRTDYLSTVSAIVNEQLAPFPSIVPGPKWNDGVSKWNAVGVKWG